MLGRVLAGRFSILSRLGEGAMGTVYRAKQSPIGREVAIKILRSERALDETSRARFLREARANSLLTSPNTVTVFDFGASEGGEFYLAMELLEGESLGQRLKRMGRLEPAAAIDTVRQALRSLAEAHAKGIIHRDLKPDNLFYARLRNNENYDEIVKVLDFGIAKMLRADDELAMNAVETQAGTVFGTPRYMSPEQAQGKPLDARSDLYSLGVILYQMLTGRPPFTDDDAIVVMARHIKTMPRPMSESAPEAHVPPEIESAVMRMLSKDPENRPQSADAMAAELGRARDSALSVTSGVRASLTEAKEAKDAKDGHVEPRPALASQTFDDVKAPRPARRWLSLGLPVSLGVALAVVAGVFFVRNPDFARTLGRAEAPAQAPPPPALPSPSPSPGSTIPHTSGSSPPPSPASPGSTLGAPLASRTPEARSGSTPPRASPSVASGQASNPADTRATPAPRRHAPPASRSTGSAPGAPSSSVGYGYLE